MPKFYTIQAPGFRTIISDGSSSFRSNTGAKIREQNFAGPSSAGLINGGAAYPKSVQFGTGAADPDGGNAGVAYTAVPPNSTSSGMESGGSSALPCLITTDGGGNQYLGYGRVYWDAATRYLHMTQFADDSLVSNNPRCQVYGHDLLLRTTQYRFAVDFTLGSRSAAWAPWVSGKNAVLIFQLKGAASYPPFDVQVRDAASGNHALRDLYFLRRTANSATGGWDSQGQDRVAVISDIDITARHTVFIDATLDWTAKSAGGMASLRIWYQGRPVTLHSDVGGGVELTSGNVYAATPDVVSPMWGVYRPNYSSVKAPDDCGITWHNAWVRVYGSKLEMAGAT